MEMALNRYGFVELNDEEMTEVEGGIAPLVLLGYVVVGGIVLLAGAGFAAGAIDGYKDAKEGK